MPGANPPLPFDETADDYAATRPPWPGEVAARIREFAPTGRAVVDLGCGPGLLSAPLAATFDRVIALDLSSPMLRRARSCTNVCYVRGRGERLPVSDAALDAVVASQSLHWMDGATVRDEAARVLAPGGALALCWRRFMADGGVEELWRDEVASLVPCGIAPQRRGDMDRVAAVFAGWGKPEAAAFRQTFRLEPTAIPAFLLSRAGTGMLGAERRDALRRRLVRVADERFRSSVDYELDVQVRLWRRP